MSHLRVARAVLIIAGLGVTLLILSPLLLFLYDSARNPEIITYKLHTEGDPPHPVLNISYAGRVFLSNFTIKIILENGQTLEGGTRLLEGGSSLALPLPVELTEDFTPKEIEVSFKVAGLYQVEVVTVGRK